LDLGFGIADCGLLNADCGLRIADCGFKVSLCSIIYILIDPSETDLKSKIQNPKSKIIFFPEPLNLEPRT